MNTTRRKFLIVLALTVSFACSAELAMAESGSKSRPKLDTQALLDGIRACEKKDGLKEQDICKTGVLLHFGYFNSNDHRFQQSLNACFFASSPKMDDPTRIADAKTIEKSRYQGVLDLCLDKAAKYFVSHPVAVSSYPEKANFLTRLCTSMDEKYAAFYDHWNTLPAKVQKDLIEMKHTCFSMTFDDLSSRDAADSFQNKVQEIVAACTATEAFRNDKYQRSADELLENKVACEESALKNLARAAAKPKAPVSIARKRPAPQAIVVGVRMKPRMHFEEPQALPERSTEEVLAESYLNQDKHAIVESLR